MPICGESDARKEKWWDGEYSTIYCANGICGSNGGDNFDAVTEEDIAKGKE